MSILECLARKPIYSRLSKWLCETPWEGRNSESGRWGEPKSDVVLHADLSYDPDHLLPPLP